MSLLGEERKSGRRRPHGYWALFLLAVLSSLPVSDADVSKISRDVSVFKMNTQFHFSCVCWFFKKEQTPHFNLYLIFAGCSVDASLLIRKSEWLIVVSSCYANIYSIVTVVWECAHELWWRDQLWERRWFPHPPAQSLLCVVWVSNSCLPERHRSCSSNFWGEAFTLI